jgi:hypothetical protein
VCYWYVSFSFFFQERRDELEGLDLAIERQKTNLKDLRREEKNLNSERQSAKEDLELISKENARLKRYDMLNIYEHFTITVKRYDMLNIYEHYNHSNKVWYVQHLWTLYNHSKKVWYVQHLWILYNHRSFIRQENKKVKWHLGFYIFKMATIAMVTIKVEKQFFSQL